MYVYNVVSFLQRCYQLSFEKVKFYIKEASVSIFPTYLFVYPALAYLPLIFIFLISA